MQHFFIFLFVLFILNFTYALLPVLREHRGLEDIYILNISEEVKIFLFLYLLLVSIISVVWGIILYLLESGLVFTFSVQGSEHFFSRALDLKFIVFSMLTLTLFLLTS